MLFFVCAAALLVGAHLLQPATPLTDFRVAPSAAQTIEARLGAIAESAPFVLPRQGTVAISATPMANAAAPATPPATVGRFRPPAPPELQLELVPLAPDSALDPTGNQDFFDPAMLAASLVPPGLARLQREEVRSPKTFRFSEVPPGRYLLRAQATRTPFALSAAREGGNLRLLLIALSLLALPMLWPWLRRLWLKSPSGA